MFDSNQAETSYHRDRNGTEPKTIQTVGPKRPVSVCSLPNEHDFDDVISKHTHCDVTIDLVTGKTHKEFILTLKQVV